MSNTFTKTSLRGFTLIELLVVIAIIGLLSTAIMGPVQTGLKKGRDTRKISDVTQVQGALLQYAGDNNGTYPQYLQNLSPTYMSVAPNMGSSTSQARDRFMYLSYADAAGNLVAYHIGVALENQNAALQTDADCDMQRSGPAVAVAGTPVTTAWGAIDGTADVTAASSTAICTNITTGSMFNSNWSINSAGNNVTSADADDEDFGGLGTQEAALGVCTSKLDSCIFDIIPK